MANQFKPDYLLPKDPIVILGLRAIDFLSDESNILKPTILPKRKVCICCDAIGFHQKDCIHLACKDYMLSD